MTDPAPDPAHTQTGYAVRFEWGPTGASAVSPGCDVAVVVDVLSFTTTLGVAVGRGIAVYPYRWRDDGAAAYAAERDAVLAVGRLEARREGAPDRATVSLSPASVARSQGIARLVLPSPNGSTIAALLADGGAAVVGASLRNATAVAHHLAPVVRAGGRVAVVAAGERWPDGSLRPSVEDLWGAGAVLALLLAAVPDADASPEARVAAAAWAAVRPDVSRALHECASGRELVAKGFAADVDVAAEVDADDVVPVLRGEVFVPG